MKKLLAFLVFAALFVGHAQAVLKEKNLARTLGVLRAELETNYEKQQTFMAMYESQAAAQHQQLVSYLNQCEQIGLMLYSQSSDNTFDVAYACSQATTLFRELSQKKGNSAQYDKITSNMQREIERYNDLISSLKSIPPVIADEADSLAEDSNNLLAAIDSLAQKKEELIASADTSLRPTPMMDEDAEQDNQPLYLTEEQQADRAACLEYAETLRDNLQTFLTNIENERQHYTAVNAKVKQLNDFAQQQYKILQDDIFRNGGNNYFQILANLPRYINSATTSAQSKYRQLSADENAYSEWRGTPVLFISLFLIFYIAIAIGLSHLIIRFLMPKKWHTEPYKDKKQILGIIIGIALFAIMVMIIRANIDRNFVQMSTSLVINMAWLIEVIFLSLFIRLKGKQMLHAAAIYTPLIIMAFIVILFRTVLIPNNITNLIYPLILLILTIWQLSLNKRYNSSLPTIDKIYINISSAVMIATCVMAWIGYTLLAVQVMIWWTFQLAAIMTVTCLYDLLKVYRNRRLVRKICPQVIDSEGHISTSHMEATLDEMQKGKHFAQTWLYDLIDLTLLPILAVASVLFSVYQAGDIFQMTDIFVSAFMVNFVDEADLIQISLSKLCIVTAMCFIFRYINTAVRNLYTHYREMTLKPGETLNITLARNVIAIVTWGLFAIITLVMLRVPSTGISIVSAGLATGVGFAMQSILENFFYGISLMTGRLRVGDYIECDGIAGKVDSITYQSTQILTADGCIIAFLNSTLFSKNFKNRTRNHSYELTKIPVGVAYGTDVNLVRKVLVEALTPLCDEVGTDGNLILQSGTKPSVAFSDFGDSSVDLLVCSWMLIQDKIPTTGRMKEIIYNTLNANNIEIPFPQRDVHIRQ